MPSTCDGKTSRCECFAQIDSQRQQARGRVSATYPQQVLVRPETNLINAQFKGLKRNVGSDSAQFRQSNFWNVAEKSQSKVNGFPPGCLAAEFPGDVVGNLGELNCQLRRRPKAEKNSGRCRLVLFIVSPVR